MNEIVLSKSSGSDELKRYFLAILQLSESGNEFPINLDDVWPLAYSQKRDAMRQLQSSQFIEGVDFIVCQNGKAVSINNLQYGIKAEVKITVSCMEYLIARKVRAVFEVYRQVFHKAVSGAIPSYQIADPIKRAERWIEEQKQLQAVQQKVIELTPKADFADQIFRSEEKINIGTCGKVLGLPFGRNTLFKKLRERGVFFSGRNEAKQKYIDAGYFVTQENLTKAGFMVVTTYATQKGLAYIGHLFGKKPNADRLSSLFAQAQQIDAQEKQNIITA